MFKKENVHPGSLAVAKLVDDEILERVYGIIGEEFGMQETHLDGTDDVRAVSDVKEIMRAFGNPENVSVAVHKPGFIFKRFNGKKCVVGSDGMLYEALHMTGSTVTGSHLTGGVVHGAEGALLYMADVTGQVWEVRRAATNRNTKKAEAACHKP